MKEKKIKLQKYEGGGNGDGKATLSKGEKSKLTLLLTSQVWTN